MQRKSDLTEYKKYFAQTGQMVYEQNRKNSKKPLKMAETAEFIKYAEEQILTNKMLSDVICKRARAKNLFKKTVCTKTLYNYIDLLLWVKINKKSRKIRKNCRILGKNIEKRSDNINERKEFGYWEIDTIAGKEIRVLFYLH